MLETYSDLRSYMEDHANERNRTYSRPYRRDGWIQKDASYKSQVEAFLDIVRENTDWEEVNLSTLDSQGIRFLNTHSQRAVVLDGYLEEITVGMPPKPFTDNMRVWVTNAHPDFLRYWLFGVDVYSYIQVTENRHGTGYEKHIYFTDPDATWKKYLTTLKEISATINAKENIIATQKAYLCSLQEVTDAKEVDKLIHTLRTRKRVSIFNLRDKLQQPSQRHPKPKEIENIKVTLLERLIEDSYEESYIDEMCDVFVTTPEAYIAYANENLTLTTLLLDCKTPDDFKTKWQEMHDRLHSWYMVGMNVGESKTYGRGYLNIKGFGNFILTIDTDIYITKQLIQIEFDYNNNHYIIPRVTSSCKDSRKLTPRPGTTTEMGIIQGTAIPEEMYEPEKLIDQKQRDEWQEKPSWEI